MLRKQEENQTERRENINEQEKQGHNYNNLRILSDRLKNIRHQVESNTVECAASQKMRSQLVRIFGNTVSIIIPNRIHYDDQPHNSYKIRGDEELLQAIECILKIKQLASQELLNPIIILWKTNTDMQSKENMRAGPHWQTYVILPRYFVNYQQKNINNPRERLLFKDSLNKKQASQLLITLLKLGLDEIIEGQGEVSSNIFGELFPNLELVLYSTDECVHQRHNDSGFWAVYNAIMFVLQDQQFLEDNIASRYLAKFPVMIKNGKQLRAIFPELTQKQKQKLNNYSQEAVFHSYCIRQYFIHSFMTEFNNQIKNEDKDKMLEVLKMNPFEKLVCFKAKYKEDFIDVDYLISEIFNTEQTQGFLEYYELKNQEYEKLRIQESVKHQERQFSFNDLLQSDFYIDKSQFIEDIWLSKGLIIIARPIGWGKTTFFQMLTTFFASKYNQGINFNADNQSNPSKRVYFEGGKFNGKQFKKLNIAERQQIMKQCGMWPVIRIAFTQQETHKQAYQYFIDAINSAFEDHWDYLIPFLQSQQQNITEKYRTASLERLQMIRYKPYDQKSGEVKSSLKFLTQLLFKFWKKKVILLIDNFDYLINKTVKKIGIHSQICQFLSSMMNRTLNCNDNIRVAVIFGNMEEKIKIVCSNIQIKQFYGLYQKRDKFSFAFGFTEDQMDTLLENVVANWNWIAQKRKIKQWFNGFYVGGSLLYSPYPILKCLGDCKMLGIEKYEDVYQPLEDKHLIQAALKDNIKQWSQRIYELVTKCKVQFSKVSQLNVDSINNFQQFGTLLITLGYLTPINEEEDIYKFPNNRMKKNFYEILLTKQLKYQAATTILQTLFRINSSLTNGQKFEKKLKDNCISHLSDHNLNEEYFKLIIGGIFCLTQLYTQEATHRAYFEVFTNDNNRIDTLFLPIKGKNQTVIIHQYKKANSQNQMADKMQQALWQMYVRGYVMYMVSQQSTNDHWKYLIARAVVFYPVLGGDAPWEVCIKENIYDFKIAKQIALKFRKFFKGILHNEEKQKKRELKQHQGFEDIHRYLSRFSLKPQQQQRPLFFKNINKKKSQRQQSDKKERSIANQIVIAQLMLKRQEKFGNNRVKYKDQNI